MRNEKEHIIIEALARKSQLGDREALKQLIKRFNKVLSYKVLHHTRDRDSLEDIVQECWYAIINNLSEVKFQIGFEAWALNIARNKAVDWIRVQQRARKIIGSSESDNFETTVDFEEEDLVEMRKKEVRICMKLLPQTQQIILELFYKENLKISEIADVLEISKGTVKSRLFNAREHLKNIIK
jgi:RNA polymerase sigma-70 factor (ECF subfamily)